MKGSVFTCTCAVKRLRRIAPTAAAVRHGHKRLMSLRTKKPYAVYMTVCSVYSRLHLYNATKLQKSLSLWVYTCNSRAQNFQVYKPKPVNSMGLQAVKQNLQIHFVCRHNHISMHIIYIYIYRYIYIYMYVYVYIGIYTYTCATYVYIYIYVYMCVCVCALHMKLYIYYIH